MKRFLAVMLAAILLIPAAAAFADGYSATDQVTIPDQIHEALKKEALSGYTATSYLEHSGSAFVVMQAENGTNILYVLNPKGSGWSVYAKTGKAIPQGTGLVTVEEDWEKGGIVLIQNYEHPYNAASDIHSFEKRAYYNKQKNGTWQLWKFRDEIAWVTIVASETRLAYYGGQDAEEYQGSAYGTVQTDLRYVNLSSLPGTLKEARNKLTIAPTLPGGTLSAEVIKFTGGKKYEVYSGPGENYLRGANGKATVSTNDWIQVFGEQNGWIMIQYAIDASHYRVGYIQSKALPKKAEVSPLPLIGDVRTVLQTATVTDDPLFSGESIAVLSEGAEVTLLGILGDYAYIEGNANGLFRGFVPVASLSAPELTGEENG